MSYCQHKNDNSQRFSPSIIMCLPVTLNHLHRYCCTALCLWFSRCWHRVVITTAAVTACIAVRAESQSEWGDIIEVFWPPGGAAFSLLSILWWQITRSTWAVNTAMGWLMGFLDGWYRWIFYLKTMATAVETSTMSLWRVTAEICVFNHNLPTDRPSKWRAEVAVCMSGGDPVAHRCLCCFRSAGGWCTYMRSMNPIQRRAINSFNWCRGLSRRSAGWWPGYGTAHRRRWVWSYDCT